MKRIAFILLSLLLTAGARAQQGSSVLEKIFLALPQSAVVEYFSEQDRKSMLSTGKIFNEKAVTRGVPIYIATFDPANGYMCCLPGTGPEDPNLENTGYRTLAYWEMAYWNLSDGRKLVVTSSWDKGDIPEDNLYNFAFYYNKNGILTQASMPEPAGGFKFNDFNVSKKHISEQGYPAVAGFMNHLRQRFDEAEYTLEYVLPRKGRVLEVNLHMYPYNDSADPIHVGKLRMDLQKDRWVVIH